jgi:hypothetical protein
MRRTWGHFTRKQKARLLLPAHRTRLFRLTTALPTPPVGVPASPWVWAKARSKLGALIRLCGDGAVSNEANMGSFYTETKSTPPPACTQNQAPPVGVPASPWVWAKARSKLGALIRLCGDGAVSNEANMGSFYTHGNKKHPSACLHTEPGSSDSPPHSRRPPLAFPPRPGCGRSQKQTRCIDSTVRRRGGVK